MKTLIFLTFLLCGKARPSKSAAIKAKLPESQSNNDSESISQPVWQTEEAPEIIELEQQRSNAGAQATTTRTRLLRNWLPSDFPNPRSPPPTTITNVCQDGRVCDPDAVLSSSEMDLVIKALHEFEQGQTLPCPNVKSSPVDGTSTITTGIPVQLGIGLVRKMDLTPYGAFDDREERAAEVFCRSIHDSWGVGYNYPECGGGTGVVVFVSILDRAMFISRGGAFDSILTNPRLDTIMQQYMKPYLRQEQYGNALIAAIHQIEVYMVMGPPKWKERMLVYLPVAVVISVFGLILLAIIKSCQMEHRAKQEYAKVKSQLSELDRSRAEALQGKYHTTSCPICLEDFKERQQQQQPQVVHFKTAKEHAPSSKEETQESLLLVSHREPSAHYHYDDDDNDDTKDDYGSATYPPFSRLVGSDGLPLKLLRCGHVFDETCWAEWVTKGNAVTKCPICQQDVGMAIIDIHDGAMTTTASTTASAANDFVLVQQQQNDMARLALEQQLRERALRHYQRERNFRLMRLGYRYPRFVQPQQIQTWTQATYDGPLTQDPTFVNSDPQLRPTASGATTTTTSLGNSGNWTSSNFSGFGGGMSSGGRGGRW